MKHNISTLKDSLRKFDSKSLHCLIVAGLLFLGSAGMSGQTNLVTNPGFEDSNTPIPIWELSSGSSITTGDFYTGTKCAYLTNIAGGYCAKTVSGLKQNTSYILSAMFKASVGTVVLYIKNYKVTDASDMISVFTNSNTWTSTGNIVFKTGSGTTARIAFSTDPGNTGYVDDFSIVEAAAESPAQAPTTPTNLTATNVLPTSFFLSWTASTDNTGIASYEVFKDGISIGSTPNGVQTSMLVTGVGAGGNYSMTVKAKDAFGNVSTVSDPIAVATGTSTTNNLIPNPDFEYQVSSPWVLYGSSVVFYNPSFSGSKCIKLMGDNNVTQIVSGLTPNTSYVFSAQCKVTATASVNIGVKNYLTSTTGDNFITATNTNWTSTGNLSFTTGPGITTVKVYAVAATQSVPTPAYVDAFSITFSSVTTGLNNTTVKRNVYSSNSNIIFEGLAAQKADIYTASGKLVKSVLIKTNIDTIKLTKGFYIVKVGSDNFKLLIQ